MTVAIWLRQLQDLSDMFGHSEGMGDLQDRVLSSKYEDTVAVQDLLIDTSGCIRR